MTSQPPSDHEAKAMLMANEELGEYVAQRLVEILRPDLDEILARLDTVLAGLEEIKGKLPPIEQHYKTCTTVPAQEGIQ